MQRLTFLLKLILCTATFLQVGCQSEQKKEISDSTKTSTTIITTEEIRQIVKEAYIYGFPIVDNSRVQYDYFVDSKGPGYKDPRNTLQYPKSRRY